MKELTTGETQNIALGILKYIADICEINGIKYFLSWGTLIGAVRHKGFIPWDDDIDICMPRQDYNAFRKILLENHNEKYCLYSMDDQENYYISLPRVIDKNTLILGERKENSNQVDCGIFVDIYPLDFVGESIDETINFFGKQMKYEWYKGMAGQEKFVRSRSNVLKSVVKFPLFCYAKIKGRLYFHNQMEKNANLHNSDNAKFCCSCYGTGGMSANKLTFPTKWFEQSVDCRFENETFKIPIGYHEILTQIYGDYMTLPPEEDRVGHHEYKAYIL